jgi:hypothetical protein
MSVTLPMSLSTDYCSAVTKILACQTIILLIFSILTLILPPGQKNAKFPAPSGTSTITEKTVSVAKYPSTRDLSSLLLLYILDIVFIYPFTLDVNASVSLTRGSTILVVFFLAGNIFLIFQANMARGWLRMERNWVAAEKNYGLWYSKAWSAYYLSFIITGTALGLISVWQIAQYLVIISLEIGPVIWIALYSEYEWLRVVIA